MYLARRRPDRGAGRRRASPGSSTRSSARAEPCPAGRRRRPGHRAGRPRDPRGVRGARRRPAPIRAPGPLRIAYTPMHGVAGALALAALRAAGYDDVHVVRRAGRARPRLPDAAVPQPRGARRARSRRGRSATRSAPTWCWPTIPTATDWAVAVPGGDGWRALTGNEIGALLADHLLARGDDPDRLVVTTIVSSRLGRPSPTAAGVHHEEMLTGFKWIVRPGHRPSPLALRVRLRGGARLLGRQLDPGQGRHHRGAGGGVARRRAQGRGSDVDRSARRPQPPLRLPRRSHLVDALPRPRLGRPDGRHDAALA